MKNVRAEVLMLLAEPISEYFLNICKQLLTRLQNNKVSYEGSKTDGITSQFGL